MKLITAEEYLQKVEETRVKFNTDKLAKYTEFKKKFTVLFNEAAETAAVKMSLEFEVEYEAKESAEPYINHFCEEVQDSFEKLEMYYDDEEADSDKPGSFIIVFSVKKK